MPAPVPEGPRSFAGAPSARGGERAVAFRRVGRYEVLSEIGRGGMAVVYLARQLDLDRRVALKELAAFSSRPTELAERFLLEARVAGSLTHPNIVTVFDYFEYDGTPYIAMEYVERGSLRRCVGHMTLAQIAGVLEGVLAGLAAAEAHEIVHRDLKPENVMVSADGRVKIADFGIAKAINTTRIGASLTATGTTLGTPHYIAPEQAMARDIGPWTDLYSLGCMAFELFVGHAPFHELDAPMAVLLAHVNEPIAPARSLNPEIDEQLSGWIERLLVKDHQQRTQSANQAWDELEEIVITLLGPRWRRSARLLEHPQTDAFRKPLTPAAFSSAPQPTTPAAGAEDEDESVKWHGAAAPTDADEVPAAAAVSPGAGAERRAPSETGPADESAEYESFVWRHPATPVQPDVVSPPPVEPPPPVPEPPARAEVTAAELPPAPAAGERSSLAAPSAALLPAEEPAAALTAQPELASESPLEPTVAPASPPPIPTTKLPTLTRRRRQRVALVIGAFVAAAVLGGVVGSSTSTTAPVPTPPSIASSGTLRLVYAAPWRVISATRPVIPGLLLSDAITLTDGARAPNFLYAGRSAAQAPSLLPTQLLSRLPSAPVAHRVRVGGLQGLDYRDLRPAGTSLRLSIIAVPTTAGVVTLACAASGRPMPAGCRSVAASLRLSTGEPLNPGPSPAYAAALAGAMRRLAAARSHAVRLLRTAHGPDRQATASRAAAQAMARARVTIAAAPTTPQQAIAHASILRALTDARSGYAKMAAGAAAHRGAVYDTGRRRALHAEKTLSSSLLALRALGYEVSR